MRPMWTRRRPEEAKFGWRELRVGGSGCAAHPDCPQLAASGDVGHHGRALAGVAAAVPSLAVGAVPT